VKASTNTPLRVAVRALCNFGARTGDLDHRYTPAPTALEGMETHQYLARARGPAYEAERSVAGYCAGLQVHGRADGYDAAAGRLDEFKTHRGDIARLNPGLQALHRAQLRCYGALLCHQLELPAITLALVYFDIHSERETAFSETADALTLWRELENLCSRYRDWALQEQQHRVKRDIDLAALQFAFPEFRAGQRDLSASVYRALTRRQALLLEAPTGSGKTVGTLFPALLALARSASDRLLYLTVRNTGRVLALDGVARLLAAQPNPPALRVLELSAREQSCEHPDLACHGESCPLARGFYDRLPAARHAAIASGAVLDQQQLRTLAQRHSVCPYYLAQELAHWADLIIADVNHLFDQHALLHALMHQHDWQVLTLIDEAHNLIERARGMYSVSLTQRRLRSARKHAPPALKRPLTAVQRAWQRLLKTHLHALDATAQEIFLDQVPTDLHGALQRLISALTDHFSTEPGNAVLQDALFEAAGFLRLAERFDTHSVCTLSRPRRGEAVLAIHNLIPADYLSPRFGACAGTVLFSATLSPADYHRDLLGLPSDTARHSVASPFSAGQLDVRLVDTISTRWSDRAQSLLPAARRIAAQFRREPANYLVYTSSFAYLDDLQAVLQSLAPEIPVIGQQPGMSAAARQQFIEGFTTASAQIGFAVLGGVFAEGIDLPGRRLMGVFVLTLGLPPHDALREVLRQRLQQRFGAGYEYAYLYPGLQKVIQAAGRVIRTPEDTGIIELIDDRFGHPQVRRLLPAWWPR